MINRLGLLLLLGSLTGCATTSKVGDLGISLFGGTVGRSSATFQGYYTFPSSNTYYDVYPAGNITRWHQIRPEELHPAKIQPPEYQFTRSFQRLCVLVLMLLLLALGVAPTKEPKRKIKSRSQKKTQRKRAKK